jgi:L-rhamnose 1-dehydrogenase
MALLANKIVCITGSSRGIGRACAVESAKHGAIGLILHYFGDEETAAELQSLKEEISTHNHCQVVGVPGDIADSETSQKVRTVRHQTTSCPSSHDIRNRSSKQVLKRSDELVGLCRT